MHRYNAAFTNVISINKTVEYSSLRDVVATNSTLLL